MATNEIGSQMLDEPNHEEWTTRLSGTSQKNRHVVYKFCAHDRIEKLAITRYNHYEDSKGSVVASGFTLTKLDRPDVSGIDFDIYDILNGVISPDHGTDVYFDVIEDQVIRIQIGLEFAQSLYDIEKVETIKRHGESDDFEFTIEVESID